VIGTSDGCCSDFSFNVKVVEDAPDITDEVDPIQIDVVQSANERLYNGCASFCGQECLIG
jgi:hypothetical protein